MTENVPRETSDKKQVQNLYAWIGITGAGNEQIMNISVGQTQFPGVATSYETAESMRPMMVRMANKTGMKVRLRKFKSDKLMREI